MFSDFDQTDPYMRYISNFFYLYLNVVYYSTRRSDNTTATTMITLTKNQFLVVANVETNASALNSYNMKYSPYDYLDQTFVACNGCMLNFNYTFAEGQGMSVRLYSNLECTEDLINFRKNLDEYVYVKLMSLTYFTVRNSI